MAKHLLCSTLISRKTFISIEKRIQYKSLKFLNHNIGCGIIACYLEEGCPIYFINDLMLKELGYTQREFFEETGGLLNAFVYREDRGLVCEYKQHGKQEGEYRAEYRLRKKNGTYIWVCDIGHMTVDKNNRKSMVSTYINITEQKFKQEKLRISEELNRIVVQFHTNKYIMRFDVRQKTLYQSERSMKIMGKQQVITNVPLSIIESGDIAKESVDDYIDFYESISQGKESGYCTYRVRVASGEFTWHHADYTLIYNQQNQPDYAIISFEDVSEQREKELAYEKWTGYNQKLMKESLIHYEFNLSKNLLECAEGKLCPQLPKEIPALYTVILVYTAENIVHPEYRKEYLSKFAREKLLAEYCAGNYEFQFECQRMDGRGDYYWAVTKMLLLQDPFSEDIKGFVYVKSIDSRKKENIELQMRSKYDNLTQLLNRGEVIRQITNVLGQSASMSHHAFIMIDIDNFKQVNDIFGHLRGDQVLTEIAADLKSVMRKTDIIGRMGGDEFVICLKDVAMSVELEEKVNFLCSIIYRKLEQKVLISASIGIALFPNDGKVFQELYQSADTALYDAKRKGRNQAVFFESHMRNKDWQPYNNTPIDAKRDMDVEIKKEQVFESYGDYDILTGFPNFNRYKVEVVKILERGSIQCYSLWYCDLKNFKFINDIYGYDVGDHVLQYWAKTIAGEIKEGEVFSRVSADHFTLFLKYNRREELVSRLKRMEETLAHFEELAGKKFRLEVVTGMYCIEKEEDIFSVEDMINRANMAQKSVKHLGGNRYALYTEEMRNQIIREKEIEAEMQEALKNHEFCFYLQPQMDIQNGKQIIGAEALVRWNRPKSGLVSPGEFIPLFEKNGFIVDLDLFVYEEVCKYLYKRKKQRKPLIKISINASRISIFQNDFAKKYEALKELYGIQDGILEIECTETAVVENTSALENVMTSMRKEGFLFALDDFGSGYSSLNMLKDVTADVLKLDMMFFRGGKDTRRDMAIVSSVISMAKALDMKVVAEGVETTEQLIQLRDMGCDFVQGYLFGCPMTVDEFERMYEDRLGAENIYN